MQTKLARLLVLAVFGGLLVMSPCVLGQESKAGERKVLTINGLEYAFRFCPSGTFAMGSPESEAGRYSWETLHRVTLTQDFWLLETEVTQEMWESVMGSNPSNFKGKKLPVEQVSWDDCQEFIRKLNQQTKPIQGLKFALPTEAQWEYACRAGTTTPFSFGSVLNGDKANCEGNRPYGTSTKGQYLEKTVAVGSYPANAWGLYDMHGNVWEWCSDWYGGDYSSGSVTNPVGPAKGSSRVYRGGGWYFLAKCCRSANRSGDVPSYRYSVIGARIALVSK